MNSHTEITPEACTGMEDIRREIDAIDRQVLALIGRRFQYVLAASKFKTSEATVRAPGRFAAMLEKRREWAIEEKLDPDVIEKMYRDLVTHFIEKEMQHWNKHKK